MLTVRQFMNVWHDTVPDAEAEARVLGVRVVAYPKGVLDAANLINQALRETVSLGLPVPDVIREDAEAIAENVRRQGGDPAKVPFQFVGGMGTRGALYHEILINPDADVWQPGQDNAAIVVDRMKRHGVFSAGVPQHLTRNEIGHFLHFINDPNLYLNLESVNLSAHAETVAQRISQYATTNPHEFVAEVYSRWAETILNSEPLPFDEEVFTLYRSFGGQEL